MNPTRTSTGLAVAVTAVVLVAFVRQIPALLLPLAVAATGAVCLRVALWLAAQNTGRTAFAASLLALPVAVGLAGGAFVMTLVAVDATFPVPNQSLLSAGTLRVIGRVGILLGGFLAVLGATLSGTAVDRDALRRYTRLSIVTGSVPVAAGLFSVVGPVGGASGGSATGLGPLASGVAPAGPTWLQSGVLLGTVAFVAFVARATETRGLLDVRGVRLLSTTVGPGLAGGTAITLASVVVADPLYARGVEATTRRVPEPVAERVRRNAAETAALFGEETTFVVLAVCLVSVTLVLVGLLRLALAVGYLAAPWAGPSLSSGGLFAAAVCAGAVGEPTWLVFVGVAASLVVWDAGQFGAVLGREVGHGETRGTELVHAGGSLLVAAVGVALAVLVLAVLPSGVADESPATALAVGSIGVGLVSLAVALR